MMLSWKGTNVWVAGQLLWMLLHLFHPGCLVRANGRYSGQRPQSMLPGYSPNINPFLPLYSNAAPYVPSFNGPSYGPGSYGTPHQQQQHLRQQQQQQQQPQYPHPAPYPNTAPAYVPIQQAYTVAYYPTYQPTTPPAPTGPYVPAPPGQRPYCAKEGQTYCEQVEYYPTKLVLRLLEYSNIDSFLINEDRNSDVRPLGYYNITPTYFYDYSYTTNSNGQVYPPGYYPHRRNKRQIDDDDMCPTDESLVTARAAENSKGDWKYVVNLPEVDSKYTQVVKISKCRSSQCRGLCTPPSGSTTRCEQQYVQTRLFALDANGDKLNNELFKFPHCCICKISSPN